MESPATDDRATPPHRMQCMEIWGSNRAIDSAVTMTGIDVRIFSQPFEQDEFGGDVYFLSSCASGRISRILLADVSGHGDQAAAVAENLRGLMQRHVNHIQQTRLCRRINEEFTESAELGYFATAVVLTYFAPSRSLSVSSAGHPPPLLYRQSTGQWSLLGADNNESIATGRSLPLGVTSQAEYTECSLKLYDGDLVVCYSDAFSESISADGKFLQSEGLVRLLADAPVDDPDALIPWLIDRLQQEDTRNLSRDDATIALIRRNEMTVSFRDNILAPWRLARDLSRRVVSR